MSGALRSLGLVASLVFAVDAGAAADERPAVPALDTPADTVAEALAGRAARDAGEPYWPYRLAMHHLERGALEPAEAALATALARDTTYVPALALRSLLWYESGRHARAIELIEGLRTETARFPDGPPAVLLEGLALHYDAVDRLDLSSAVLAELAARGEAPSPGTAAYLALRGDAPATGTGPAAEALKESPDRAVNQNNYGITKLRAGEVEAARRAFLAAVEIDPRLPGPYYNLAILERYYALDDAAAARWLARYRERSSLDPDGLFEAPGEAAPAAADENED